MVEVKYAFGFLFFSAVLHLPDGQGLFLLGGSDEDENHYRRVVWFREYNYYVEKPQMAFARSFFPA